MIDRLEGPRLRQQVAPRAPSGGRGRGGAGVPAGAPPPPAAPEAGGPEGARRAPGDRGCPTGLSVFHSKRGQKRRVSRESP